MAPTLTANDPVDSRYGDMHFVRQIDHTNLSTRITLPDLKNLNIREFCLRQLSAVANFLRMKTSTVPLAFRLTSLLNHVRQIHSTCSKKQMLRIHARWVVARVAHIHAWWDGAVMEFPRHARGQLHFAANTDASATILLESRSKPRPALVRPTSIDLSPETIRQWAQRFLSCPVTRTATELRPTNFHFMRVGKKCRSALLARAQDSKSLSVRAPSHDRPFYNVA
jgi:hypothetical protein